MSEKKLLTGIEWLQSIKEMKNEQTIKAAARGLFKNRLQTTTKRKKPMNEKIIEKLMTENLMLSNDNVKLRQAYMQLLDVYCELIKAKNPDNLMLPGRNDWENKIK
jgi:hypothetical protein